MGKITFKTLKPLTFNHLIVISFVFRLNFISYGISSERYRTELIKIVKKVICWDKFSHSPVRTNEPDQAIGRRATTTGGQL